MFDLGGPQGIERGVGVPVSCLDFVVDRAHGLIPGGNGTSKSFGIEAAVVLDHLATACRVDRRHVARSDQV